MGNKVGADGMKPDDEKINAILNMPDPQKREDVQRLMGMLAYLSPYIPNMSSVTSSIVAC